MNKSHDYPRAHLFTTRVGARPNFADCIVPAGQWDGDTGVPALLEQYRLESDTIFSPLSHIPSARPAPARQKKSPASRRTKAQKNKAKVVSL